MFIFPNSELSVQLFRMLVILDNTSLNRNGKPVLNIEKLSVFDFLIQHPYILFSILKDQNKRNNLVLTDVDYNSISREYPNTDSLFSFDSARRTLQILIGHGFCEVNLLEGGSVVFLISDKGEEFVDGVETSYADKLRQFAKELKILQAESYKNLINYIKPYTNGR